MRILYLDLDTLRPDHLGCYGYGRDTSPNIDKIAKDGVRFENYYCSDAPCLPSRTALMTGMFGIHSGVVNHGGVAADLRLEGKGRDFRSMLGRESLPAFLRECGFKTVSVSPFAERHSSWWFNAGFNEIYNTGKCGMESAEEVTPTVLKWIENNAGEDNWFLQVNYWDPHTPYRAPEEFGNPFENEPMPGWITEDVFKEHLKHAGPHSLWELNMFHGNEDPRYPRYPGEAKDMKTLKKFFDGYDSGIRYMDEHIGSLLDAFSQKGVLDDMVIIISSDHGENMGELGIYGEHATADNVTPKIPMIIRWPGMQKGHVDKGLHYNLDLGPTLAELLNRQAPASWDGQSYALTVKDGVDCGRDYLVLSQCAHVCQRSVRFDNWIYIRSYHDGYHLFPDEMLFDVDKDPHEQNNLVKERKDICKEAVYRLNQWHDEMMKTMDHDADPLWTVMNEGGPFHIKYADLKEYCKRLEKTGRGCAVEKYREKYPDKFR